MSKIKGGGSPKIPKATTAKTQSKAGSAKAAPKKEQAKVAWNDSWQPTKDRTVAKGKQAVKIAWMDTWNGNSQA